MYRLSILLSAVVLCATTSAPEAPAQVHDHAVCATPIVMEAWGQPEKMKRVLGSLQLDCAGRPAKQNSILSRDGHFRIHFDTFGEEAVDPTDNNGNGVPDYIDSTDFYLEYAWQVEVEQLGYKPPTDNSLGGPEVDVYICNLPTIYYGLAQPDNTLLSTNPKRVGGTLLLDNDYAGYQTPGIAGLKVTSAHEFHHLIQFSAYRFDLSQAALYEATATWMEKVLHPDVKDYRNYTDAFLQAPQQYAFSTHLVRNGVTGYAHMLYLQYLRERIGRFDQQLGLDVVRFIWEEFESSESFPAIDQALIRVTEMIDDSELRLNLEKSYCEFAQWSYYTGYRADSLAYFEESPQLPAMMPVMTRALEPGIDLVIGDSLAPLAFGLYRILVPTDNVNLPDTVDFLVTNARSTIGAGGPSNKGEWFTLTFSLDEQSGFSPAKRADTTLLYFSIDTPNSMFCYLPIIDGEQTVTIAARVSPQPFYNDGANRVMIGIEDSNVLIEHVDVWIYSSSMTAVRHITQKELSPSEFNLLGVLWDGRDSRGQRVPTGVYIYELVVNRGSNNARHTLGKIAVIRR